MPHLAGIFYSESSADIGTGSTKQESRTLLRWLAIHLEGGNVLLRALDGNGLPSAISKTVSTKEFYRDYLPDRAHYQQRILPLLETLLGKLAGSGEAQLDKVEKQVFAALQLRAKADPESARKSVLELLTSLPDQAQMVLEHARQINNESIASRKNGNYEESISLYRALLRASPEDTHVFFNVARVLFEKKDYLSCRKYLQLAMEFDPNFTEARKFMAYLEKHAPLDQPDGRSRLRFQFQTPQSCTLLVKDKNIPAQILDISEAGTRFKVENGGRALLQTGQVVSVQGQSSLLAPLLSGKGAQVVWVAKDSCGALFDSSLDRRSPAFKRLVAYTQVV